MSALEVSLFPESRYTNRHLLTYLLTLANKRPTSVYNIYNKAIIM